MIIKNTLDCARIESDSQVINVSHAVVYAVNVVKFNTFELVKDVKFESMFESTLASLISFDYAENYESKLHAKPKMLFSMQLNRQIQWSAVFIVFLILLK